MVQLSDGRMMRDFKENPYSPCEARVAAFLHEVGGIGGGDDPIGFLMASHAALAAERRELLEKLNMIGMGAGA